MRLSRGVSLAFWVSTLAALAAPLAAQPLPATLVLEERPLDGAGWRLRFTSADREVAATLAPLLLESRSTVEAFFDAPFSGPVAVTVVPDRESFTAVLNAAWQIPETACWMVATGVADFVVVLSPRVWREQACEHDPADARHLEDVLTHELAHSYHGQHNPTRDFTGMDPLGWFVEGLAVLVAGQLDRDRLSRPEEALREGAGPRSLETAWSGRYRYGVSGSLVQFIDTRMGRSGLRGLLAATRQDEVLGAVGLTEPALLAAWEQWVVSARSAGERQ